MLKLCFIVFISFMVGCGNADFVYLKPNLNANRNEKVFQVKEMSLGSGAIDIVWIIDNSGSMSTYQKQVVQNAESFMKDFIGQSVNWKMGLISTSEGEKPYVGFAGTDSLDSTVPSPLNIFTAAVNRLGTSGDSTEKTFEPILKALKNDPGFARPGVPTAFIMVTDAPEQSSVTAPQFLEGFRGLLGNRKYFAYGIYAAHDFNCEGEGSWKYAGSPYEEFINSAAVGRHYSLCEEFGPTLSKIGHQIATSITHSVFNLNRRPKLSTLRVEYQGVALPPGPRDQNGWWIYDEGLNAIIFNSLAFAVNDSDAVKIIFDEDVGQD